jgi:hypothetical protein
MAWQQRVALVRLHCNDLGAHGLNVITCALDTLAHLPLDCPLLVLSRGFSQLTCADGRSYADAAHASIRESSGGSTWLHVRPTLGYTQLTGVAPAWLQDVRQLS